MEICEAAKENMDLENETDFFLGTEYFSMKELVPDYIHRLASQRSIRETDVILNPCKDKTFDFKKGDLVVIFSKQSVYRTQFALKWVREFACRQKKSVGFISCGFLDYNDIVLRLFSSESKINIHNLRGSRLGSKGMVRLQEAADYLYDQPIYISHLPNTDFDMLEMIAAAIVETRKLEILFVDGFEYLYEIVVSKLEVDKIEGCFFPVKKRAYYNEIENTIERFRDLAKKLGIPIVLTMPVNKDKYIAEAFEDRLVIPLRADKVFLLSRASGGYSNGRDGEIITVKSSRLPDVEVEFLPNTRDFKFIEEEN